MSDEVRESGWSKEGACSGAKSVGPTSDGRSPKGKAKSYGITPLEVLEVYFKVKSNKGAAGIEWFNYYGRFNPSALRPIERHVGRSLVRWACYKYKTLRNHRTRARRGGCFEF